MFLQESVDNVLTKGERNFAFTGAPALLIPHGVAPQQIANNSCVSNVGRPFDRFKLVHGVMFGRQTPVDAEDFVINNRSDWKTVKTVREYFPQLHAVPPLALLVETVQAVDRGGLVVAPQEEKNFPDT